MPSVPFGLCIWSSYKLNSKERWSCIANHCWPCFEFTLEEKINLLILQGGSPIEGVIAGDRLAEVVETFSHIRQPWSPNNGGSTGRARIWCQESTFPWNTLGPLMYRVSWWIPFGYLFTLCGVLCFLVFTAMHRWLRKQWWVGASIWSRAPNTKRWHTRPTRVAHTQVCFVHRETI